MEEATLPVEQFDIIISEVSVKCTSRRILILQPADNASFLLTVDGLLFALREHAGHCSPCP